MPDSADTIYTERLDLVTFTAKFLRASLGGELAAAEQLLGAGMPAGWPDYPRIHRLRLSQLEADPMLTRWLMRGMVLRSERRLIGHIGFHAAPGAEYLRALAPGGIEFGFEVFAPWRRQGFASEAAEALMRWARTGHGVTRFLVSISPRNAPSLGLAAKFGFRRIGSQLDEEDGPEDIFERVIE
jgi:[ribosomal protein S5]-alanine N-acetyltransferase